MKKILKNIKIFLSNNGINLYLVLNVIIIYFPTYVPIYLTLFLIECVHKEPKQPCAYPSSMCYLALEFN